MIRFIAKSIPIFDDCFPTNAVLISNEKIKEFAKNLLDNLSKTVYVKDFYLEFSDMLIKFGTYDNIKKRNIADNTFIVVYIDLSKCDANYLYNKIQIYHLIKNGWFQTEREFWGLGFQKYINDYLRDYVFAKKYQLEIAPRYHLTKTLSNFSYFLKWVEFSNFPIQLKTKSIIKKLYKIYCHFVQNIKIESNTWI